MSKTPFMPLWVADFVGDTMDLDAKEVGAYMLLLMAMWTRGGTLPNDQSKLKRVARVGRDWPKVWTAIGPYFTVDGDTITQGRLQEEMHKVDTKRRVNAQSGARGGRAKVLKDKETALANATVSLQQPYPYPEREKEDTYVSSQKKPKKRGSRLPENWVLPKQWGEWASGEGWPEMSIRDQADRFRDYWVAAPGQKGVKLDWLATWRNWMRNSNAPKTIDGGKSGKPASKSKERMDAFIAGARGAS